MSQRTTLLAGLTVLAVSCGGGAQELAELREIVEAQQKKLQEFEESNSAPATTTEPQSTMPDAFETPPPVAEAEAEACTNLVFDADKARSERCVEQEFERLIGVLPACSGLDRERGKARHIEPCFESVTFLLQKSSVPSMRELGQSYTMLWDNRHTCLEREEHENFHGITAVFLELLANEAVAGASDRAQLGDEVTMLLAKKAKYIRECEGKVGSLATATSEKSTVPTSDAGISTAGEVKSYAFNSRYGYKEQNPYIKGSTSTDVCITVVGDYANEIFRAREVERHVAVGEAVDQMRCKHRAHTVECGTYGHQVEATGGCKGDELAVLTYTGPMVGQ